MKTYFRAIWLSTAFIVALLAVVSLLIGFRLMSVQASTIKVGLVTDTGTLADKGINWFSYQGLLRAEQELGVDGTVYTSTDPSDFEPNLDLCVQDGNDLCIGTSFMLADAISKTAAIYTDTAFAILDTALGSYSPNLRGVLFEAGQPSYMAGTLAAFMSQSNILGDIGGAEIQSVINFTEAFSNGAHCANPAVSTIITYTNVFSDPEVGAQYAQALIAQGADVIFAAAGQTGNGAILTATQSDVWAIGVDTDQYVTLFMSGTVPGSNYLLTSAMKRFDTAVFNTALDVISGTFSPGTVVYGLAQDGVGLASFHETDPFIPAEVRTRLDWVKRSLTTGLIDPLDPNSPCFELHKLFLPITVQ